MYDADVQLLDTRKMGPQELYILTVDVTGSACVLVADCEVQGSRDRPLQHFLREGQMNAVAELDVSPEDVRAEDDVAPILADGHEEEEGAPGCFAATHGGTEAMTALRIHREEVDIHQ